VPFHSGWELVEWRPKLVDLGVGTVEIVEICDEVEEKEPEVFGPHIELNLENPSDLGEPPVEATGEAPAMVEIEEEPSVEGKSVEELGTGDEPVLADVEMGSGCMLVLRAEGGDSFFEDYSRDDFEKVGEINLEETPSELVLSVPSEEIPSSTEPRRKRIKTLAGRTDLPWVQKLIAQRSQTSPSSHQSSHKQPTQPTWKSHHLAAQGSIGRSSSIEQGDPVIEEILSSSEGSPIKSPETPAVPQDSPVLESEQASTETSPK